MVKFLVAGPFRVSEDFIKTFPKSGSFIQPVNFSLAFFLAPFPGVKEVTFNVTSFILRKNKEVSLERTHVLRLKSLV